jgi:hypothetical protein
MPSVGVFLLTALAVATNALACPMCGAAIKGDDPFAGAINASILFLMITPYTLLGGVALWLFVQYRRRTARRPGAVIDFPWDRQATPSPTDSKEE